MKMKNSVFVLLALSLFASYSAEAANVYQVLCDDLKMVVRLAGPKLHVPESAEYKEIKELTVRGGRPGIPLVFPRVHMEEGTEKHGLFVSAPYLRDDLRANEVLPYSACVVIAQGDLAKEIAEKRAELLKTTKSDFILQIETAELRQAANKTALKDGRK